MISISWSDEAKAQKKRNIAWCGHLFGGHQVVVVSSIIHEQTKRKIKYQTCDAGHWME